LGETANTLTLTNVQAEQSGTYSVLVTNMNGSVTAVVRLPVVAPPLIELTGLDSTGTNSSISLSSVVGLSYTLEYKNSLTDATWTPILPPKAGSGGPLLLQDTNPASLPTRFYRITAQ
jgi:hypothetical protein